MIRTLVGLIALIGLAAGAAAKPEATLHHDVELRLAPRDGTLEAVDRITVQGREALQIRLAPGLTLRRLELDGRALELGTNGQIALGGAGPHELVLDYGGRLESSHGGAASMAFLGAKGAFLPFGWAWLPSTGDQWATFRVLVDTPAPYKAIVTGRLVREEMTEENYRAEFVSDRAMELPSLFAGPYVVDERQHGAIRLRTYFYEEDEPLAGLYLDQAAQYLDRFEAVIGPYPYESFRMIAAPLPVGLGFPGLTYVAQRILPMPFMQTRSLAHEILHNWWANGVFVDYRSGNWAEGLTTYMADYALAEDEGPERAREMRLGWLRDFAALPPDRDAAVIDFVAKQHDAAQVVGYNKVALIFHMLRQELGAETFQAAIQHFWQQERFELASWQDLQQSFEAVAGEDLEAFFDQWLRRPGGPSLDLDDATVVAVDDGHQIELTLRQDAPPYRLAVPVAVETAAGWEAAKIAVLDETASAVIPVQEAPLAVAIDPDYDLFRRLAPGEAAPILRDVTLNGATQTIIAVGEDRAADVAARELAASLLDTEVHLAALDAIDAAPLLVIGLTAEVDAVLERAGLDPTPDSLAGKGTARSWTLRPPDRAPVLVVAAESAEALETLRGPLPHYGRRSFLVFDGREAVVKGVWPTRDSPLSRRFD